MADVHVQKFLDILPYEVDDVQGTRFTTMMYYIGIEEAVRAVKRTIEYINPDYVHLVDGQANKTYRAVPETVRSGAASYPADSGTADDIAGGSSNELLDTDKNWVTDEWADYTCYLTTGTGAGQSATIASNTYSTLKIEGTWTTEPDGTTQYEIRPPDDVLYDSALTTPLNKDLWSNPRVRITSGTGAGQEREIDTMKGYEIKVATEWSTVPADGDTYEVVAPARDYALPSDFKTPIAVEVDGEEIGTWDPESDYTENDRDYCWSIVGATTSTAYLRVRGLTGGEIIDLHYQATDPDIVSSGSAGTTITVPFSGVFFDAMRYYVVQKLKGIKYENIVMDRMFAGPIEQHLRKVITDTNIPADTAIKSRWEDFEG